MTGTIIALIVIGIIFVFASFFMSEALADSIAEDRKDNIEFDVQLTDEQLEYARQQISDSVNNYCENIIYQTESQLSSMSNEKTMALGDYAVSVCEEIDKNHKEAMFLYSMLDNKEKELKMLVQQIDEIKQEVQQVSAQTPSPAETDRQRRGQMPKQEQTYREEAMQPEPERQAAAAAKSSEEDMFEKALEEIDNMDIDFADDREPSAEAETDNANDLILEMKKSGMSNMEIAKQLGLGVGEVKLVVDLFQS